MGLPEKNFYGGDCPGPQFVGGGTGDRGSSGRLIDPDSGTVLTNQIIMIKDWKIRRWAGTGASGECDGD